MTTQYSPKAFLRQAPNGLLARYFDGQGVLAEVNIAALDETAIDPVYDAWSDLPAEVRTQVDANFRDIEALANEAGTRTLLEEARFHDEDLEPLFAEMDGFYDRAFWAPRLYPGRDSCVSPRGGTRSQRGIASTLGPSRGGSYLPSKGS